MGYVAVFDIGTTAVKGVVIDEAMHIKEAHTVALRTSTPGAGRVEQQPADWWHAIRTIATNWWENGIRSQDIKAITFSGQMEDVITISKQKKTYPAILYADTRAGKEAAKISQDFPAIHESTGNQIGPTTPLAKLTWLQQHAREQYEDAEAFVFCAKDYVIHQLTGEAVADAVTASTTGMMDLHTQTWNTAMLEACGLDTEKLPQLMASDATVGTVTPEASVATGFAINTIVVNGSGDAGASTLGAGAIRPDDCYFYMGTTGWLATVAENKKVETLSEGHFNLAYVEDRRISVAPLLNVGNIHQWAMETYSEKAADVTVDPYAAFEKLIASAEVGSGGVVFLPYVHGERNPVLDTDAKGAYWGIHAATKKQEMARAALEGVTFSLKQTLDLFQLEDKRTITLIGGGSKSDTWCQMMADVMQHPMRVPSNSEYLPSLGIAASAFLALGWTESYEGFLEKLQETQPAKTYTPNQENMKKYEQHYKTYAKLYPAMTQMYN